MTSAILNFRNIIRRSNRNGPDCLHFETSKDMIDLMQAMPETFINLRL